MTPAQEMKRMKVECDLRHTEDPEKVLRMLRDFFPGAEFKVEGDKITGEADEQEFWRRVEEQGIRPALEKELEENGFLELSKLAMLSGKASVDAGFPLGCVRVYPSRAPQKVI